MVINTLQPEIRFCLAPFASADSWAGLGISSWLCVTGPFTPSFLQLLPSSWAVASPLQPFPAFGKQPTSIGHQSWRWEGASASQPGIEQLRKQKTPFKCHQEAAVLCGLPGDEQPRCHQRGASRDTALGHPPLCFLLRERRLSHPLHTLLFGAICFNEDDFQSHSDANFYR